MEFLKIVIFIFFTLFSSFAYSCSVDVYFVNGVKTTEPQSVRYAESLKNILSDMSDICKVESVYNSSGGYTKDLFELELGKASLSSNWQDEINNLVKASVLYISDRSVSIMSNILSGNISNESQSLIKMADQDYEKLIAKVQSSYNSGKRKVIIVTHSQGSMFGKLARLHFYSLGKTQAQLQVFYVAPAVNVDNEPLCGNTDKNDDCYIISDKDLVIAGVSDKSRVNYFAEYKESDWQTLGHAFIDYYLNDLTFGSFTDFTGTSFTSRKASQIIHDSIANMVNHRPRIFVK